MPLYVMVARTRASAIFYPGDEFSMHWRYGQLEPFNLRFTTTYKDQGLKAEVPVDFCVEARGTAANAQEAHDAFGSAARWISSLIAVASNATMGLLEQELIFDATPGSNKHEFFQSFLPDQPVTLVPGRRIDVELLRALVQALNGHPHRDRLSNAIYQYVEALRSWQPANEVTRLAHLFMGIEAVKEPVFAEHLRREGKTKDQIIEEWKLNREERQLNYKLYGEVRRRLIFGGDSETASKAKDVSDIFEHGWSDIGDTQKPALEVIEKTAECLRRAILETIGIEQALIARAFAPPYSIPLGPLRLMRVIRGTLNGSAESLAAGGEQYPMFHWKNTLANVQISEDGVYGFTTTDNVTANFGPGVSMDWSGYDWWNGSKIIPDRMPLRPDVKKTD